MGEFIGLMAVLGTAAFFLALVVVPAYYKNKDRERMQATLRASIEAGQPLPPEVIHAIASSSQVLPSRVRDFRRGVIWLAIAGALATIGAIIGWHEGYDDEHMAPFVFAVLPLFLGVTFIIFGFLNKSRD